MGNTQSTGGHHNKLSKPKTNTNSPCPNQHSPVSSPPTKYAELSVKDRLLFKTQLTAPPEKELGPRLSYEDNDESMGELASHVQVRLSNLSRSNSAASQVGSKYGSTTKLNSLPGSKLSLVSNNQPVDLATAIKLLQEVRKTASPEDLAALHEALQPSASPNSSKDLSHRASVNIRSTSSLIRRRSLVVEPGVATRNSPTTATQRTWSSWRTSQQAPREAKWRKDMMGSSPLTRLAALDLAEEGRESPTPRARTPGEMEYSHLGALRLGSLIVTNGAPSPAASTRKVTRHDSKLDTSTEEDYFTASEGSSSPAKFMSAHRRGHSRSKSSVLPVSPPLHRDVGKVEDTRQAKTTSRCDSPLKLEVQSREIFELDSDTESLRRSLHIVNKSADTLARDYMAEIPNSPFYPQDNTPQHQDEGFADADDAASFRNEAFRILDGTIFTESTVALESPRPTAESAPSPEASRRGKGRRPTPRKADSGYSSGGSFRVAQDAAMQEGTIPASSSSTIVKKNSASTNLQKSGNGSDNDDSTSLYTFTEMLALPVSKKPLPPLPTDVNIERRSSHKEVPEILKIQAEVTVSPISPMTPVSVTSKFSVDTKSSDQRRLQKRRPSFQSLPVVQTCGPVAEGSIPSVPDNVRVQFVRRLSESPAMECLTRTFPSKDHETNDESTIDSPQPFQIEFPSPSTTPETRGRRHFRSQTERPPTPPPHGTRSSFSLFRRKSEVRNVQDLDRDVQNSALGIVDLGTVASTLGQSPYDAAMPTLPKTTVTSPTQPHHLSNALPRAKSMVNMDAKTAVEVARLRSKDRALLRPGMPQRPRSYHEMNMEAGEAIVLKRRAHSTYVDLPPMPSTGSRSRSLARHPSPQTQAHLAPIETSPGSSIRAKSTGRGPMVSQLVDKYDHHDHTPDMDQDTNWDAQARLWSQRRKSIGEGLRQRAEADGVHANNPRSAASQSSRTPDKLVVDRYSGGLDYGYEGRGYGVGGSAGTRILHSAASRKSLHFSNQYGVDLSDVPVFLQRVQPA